MFLKYKVTIPEAPGKLVRKTVEVKHLLSLNTSVFTIRRSGDMARIRRTAVQTLEMSSRSLDEVLSFINTSAEDATESEAGVWLHSLDIL